MHNRPLFVGAASGNYRIRFGRLCHTCARFAGAIALAALLTSVTIAQNMVMPAAEPVAAEMVAPPVAQSGNVAFMSQDLGTILRLRYNTESYGQDGQGNFDIGSMQVITFEESAAFVDGQVTGNDMDGIGFNVGVGYRMINFPSYAMDTGRMDGISLWVDGTHTNSGNFFPQIGLSYESLGELWDARVNGYIPVGKQDQVGPFRETGQIGFQGNSISQITQAVVDSSFNVGEIEIARRLGAERDAWAFAGPYFLGNDDQDATGYRLGVRGYAYPDLLLQVAVSNDDIFKTNAAFQVQWFVGRTRTDFQPAGNILDRLREPVMRNDYVTLAHNTTTGGNPLTNPDGSALRVVHVASNAAAGGNGTIENPYNELDQADGAGSEPGDIIFAHSTSTFDTAIVLQDDQRFLGEGDNLVFTVDTAQEGMIDIPESSPGARALARPMIVAAMGDAVTLADNNEVANFTIDGNGVTARAIAAPAGGAGNPNMNNLAISDTTGDAIAFTPLTTAENIVRGSVTIDTVTFDNIGGDEIDINSFTTTDVTAPGVTLQETIAISDVTSTNGNGAGVRLRNTHSAGTASITNYTNGNTTAGSGGGTALDGVLVFTGDNATTSQFAGDLTLDNVDIQQNIGFAFDFLNVATTSAVTLRNGSSYDGGAGNAGGFRANNFDGTLTASNTTFTNGLLSGVSLLGDSDGTFNFQSTVTFNSIEGTAFEINGDVGGVDQFGGSVTVAGVINNDTEGSVAVSNVTTGANIAFNGNITDTGTGIIVQQNSGGTVTFVGDLDMDIDTAGETAVLVADNTGATIDFAGDVNINSTSTAEGFVATGGGTLSMPSTVNSISTETGRALVINDMTIAAGGVRVADVNRTSGAATNAIQLERNTGGAITIGATTDLAGDAGTIEGGTADAVNIANSANVSITGLRINNGANAVSGVRVLKSNTAAMTTNLSDLEINGGDIGIETVGGGTGAVTMTINDTAINSPTAQGLLFDNLDVGTVAVNATTIDGNNANGTAAGVLILNSNASFTFDASTAIQEFGGNDLEVNGGTGTVSFAGDIVNSTTVNPGDTTGQSLRVHNITGGSVTLTAASSINDDNGGITIDNNGTGSVNVLGTNTLNTTGDAILISNNDVGGVNSNVTLAGLNITTTGTGRGLVAELGGTLSVTGTTNDIDTENGTGLSITNMTIGSVDFREVTVDGGTGPANAIVLQTLTGGQVAIGPASGAVGAGGQLRSTDDAIVIQDAQNVDIRQVQILNAGNAAGDHGIQITHSAGATTTMDITIDGLDVDAAFGDAINVTGASAQSFNLRITDGDLESQVAIALTGAGHFGLLVDSTDIDAQAGLDAFSLSQSGNAQNADVTIRNGNNFVAGDANALFIDSAGASGKTFNLLVEDSTFSNNSAASPTADITARQTSLMNNTIQGNTFTNSNGAGGNVAITSNGAAAFMNLNLGGDGADRNTASGGTGEYVLSELVGSDFNVFERDDTFANLRNTGTVVPVPNAGAFDDLPVAPPLPTVP